jgi:hypothetical protein
MTKLTEHLRQIESTLDEAFADIYGLENDYAKAALEKIGRSSGKIMRLRSLLHPIFKDSELDEIIGLEFDITEAENERRKKSAMVLHKND